VGAARLGLLTRVKDMVASGVALTSTDTVRRDHRHRPGVDGASLPSHLSASVDSHLGRIRCRGWRCGWWSVLPVVVARRACRSNRRCCVVLQSGSTVLAQAAAHGHLDIVKFAVSKDAVVDAVNLVRSRCCFCFCFSASLLLLLLTSDWTPHTHVRGQDGDTPLLLASASAHIPVVEFLLSKKARIDYCRPVSGLRHPKTVSSSSSSLLLLSIVMV
jgi:hypothetical protein